MALEKVITYDYEVRGEHKHINQREKTTIQEVAAKQGLMAS